MKNKSGIFLSTNIKQGLSESVSNFSNGHSGARNPNLKHQKTVKNGVKQIPTALFYRFFLEVKYFIIISIMGYPNLYLTFPKVFTVKSYVGVGNPPNLCLK